MNGEEFAELAAGHALNALSPEDERAYRSALVEHPEWADIALADAETAAVLAEGIAEVAPPPAVRAALLAAIAQPAEPEEPSPLADIPFSTEAIQTVQRRTWTRGVLALAASIVLLVALGFGAAYVGDLVAPKSAAVVALQEIENAPDAQTVVGAAADGGTVTAHWSGSLGKAVVVTDGLPALSSGEVYQAWFVRGETPVAAGVLETNAEGSTTALLSAEMHANDVIALTIEPAGGSEVPTTAPVVQIPTA